MSLDITNYLNSYEFSCDLPSDGRTITFKPFTTGQMKKLLTYENVEDPFVVEQILDDLITDCVITEGFNLDDLLLQDRFYLLLKIREKSKGDVYNYTYTCPECETDNVDNVKISEMKVTSMDVDITPIPLTDKLSVLMKLITRGEQKEIYKIIGPAKLTMEQKIVEAVTMGVALSMNTFFADGEEDSDVSMKDKMDFINNGLPSSGFDSLKQWLQDNDFGIKFETPIICMGCGRSDTFAIPIDGFFD